MNIDNIIIKPKNTNFLELLESNINNDNYQVSGDNIKQKPFRKYTPPPKKNIEIKIPQNNEIKKYRYYTDNFKKKKKSKTQGEEQKDKDINNINKQNTEQENEDGNNIKFTQDIINDFFIKNANDNNQNKLRKSVINTFNNNKRKINKINNDDSLLNNIEYENNNNKEHENKFNSINVQQNSELNKFNKVKNEINISSSINNLKGYSHKGSNNYTLNTCQGINIISNNIPYEDSMQNEINNILNLNNNIDIDNNKFNTIHNMKHSHSTKSFVFRKKVKNQNKSPLNNFDPIEIMKKANLEKNVLNNKETEQNRIDKLEQNINNIKKEYEKIKKEKTNMENLNRIIQSEIRNFNKQKQTEKENFEKYKNDKLKKLSNERNNIAYETQQLNELKKKYKDFNNTIIEHNYNEIDGNNHENKKIFELYQKKLEEAYNKIFELEIIIKQLQMNKNNNNNINNNKDIINVNNIIPNNINIEDNDEDDDSEFDDDENYELVLPAIYHNIQYNLIKTENDKDGKIKKIYDKNKIEIIHNGEKKEIFDDKYEIIHFSNGDIKQIFKKKGKQVYFFSKQKILKTTFETGLQIIKYDNGQIEKIFADGTKKISFPDGSLRYIFPNRLQETYYPDGSVERIDKEGNVILEHEDGTKELMYNFNKKNLN